MSWERKRIESIYGHRYKKISPTRIADKNICYYCGNIYEELDHLPSLANVEYFDMAGIHCSHILVPSCSECNQLAGDSMCTSLEERSELIHSKLEKKYKKHIKSYLLGGDVSYMKASLKKSVKEYERLGKEALERVKFCGYELEEVDGVDLKRSNVKTISACGRMFRTFTEAMMHGMKQYRISEKEFSASISSLSRKGESISIDDVCINAKKVKLEMYMAKNIADWCKDNYQSVPRKTIESYVKKRSSALSTNIEFESKHMIDTFLKS